MTEPAPRRRTLRSGLFWAILGTVLLGIGVSAALGIALTRDATRDAIARDLGRQADIASTRLQIGGLGGLVPPPTSLQPDDRDGRLDGDGRLPGRGDGPPGFGGPGGPEPRIISLDRAERLFGAGAAAKLRAGQGVDGTARIRGREQIYAARPVDGRVLVLSRPELRTSDYSRYLAAILIAGGLGVVLAAITAALLARRFTAPLQRLATATRELASGRDPEPLPPERTAELAAVSEAFNDMASQLGQAREAERAVLLSVSHELRTPLTAIRGYAEGIEDGTVEPVSAAGVVGREAGRLERLVADLLALAKLEQGVLEVRAEPVDLAEAAREVGARLAPLARERAVRLEVRADGPAVVTGDHDRIVQVLSNLVDNALRATPPDGEVRVAAAGRDAEVTDTGPGIPAEDLPHAFERFHLHRRSGRGSPDGSGLGLAIVQQLTEAMGGSVGVQNVPGAGARFTVRLPAAAPGPDGAAPTGQNGAGAGSSAVRAAGS